MDIFKNVKTIFFDYDGTLHDSMNIYKPALNKAYSYLVEEGLAEPRDLKDEEIKYWLGFNSIDMWAKFMPELSKEMQTKARKMVGAEMKSLVEQKKAALYEGALETLEYLKSKGYRLVFVSNCSHYYKDMHNEAFNLDKYFEELACAQQYEYIPKYEFLAKVMTKYPKNMVIVGDRHHDMKAGKMNNIYTIGCDYGFGLEGELDEADIIIKDIRELKEYL
ncbi:HAD family hydrolase [Clostridium ganghwense]|uniref:HAD family hydrolase n=1 Tax=Clostridium ganghwense TaxID=312089 RepID=A0ABT4CPJ2_9CLOT|nr:HAD family hydrolase [Clostridium ganghwense]MCY6370151.1 HAD family hydrolase [Clostridium ganghwense]